MPDLGLGTITSTTDLSNTIKNFYDRMLLEVLDPNTRYYQFGMPKPLPGAEGTSVYWNRPTRLSLGQKITAGLKPSANELSTARVSALIEQYAGYTLLEDLVQLTSITDVMNLATERLAVQAAETLDQAIVQAIVKHADIVGVSSVNYIKSSAGSYISTQAFIANTYSNTVLAVSDVRAASVELRRRNASPYDGQNFVGIIHPVVSEDLTSDTTWQNWHQYTTPEFLYAGEIGRVHGVRFVESTLNPVSTGSANGFAISAAGLASALAYGTPIFGRGFYGVTELDGGIKTYLATGASKSDPVNQASTYGWKAFFTSKLLNVSAGVILWSGSNDVTQSSSTSARATDGYSLDAIPTAA